MNFDNLTASALVIVIILIIVAFMLTTHKTHTDRKIRKVVKQMALTQHNASAMQLCKDICKNHPELCAGIDFTIKENGDNVEVDEWHSDQPRPDSNKKS